MSHPDESRAPRQREAGVSDDGRCRIVWAGGAIATHVRRLRAAGFEVTAAADGAAGWRAIRVRRPDLVLGALAMPRVDGVELLRRLRADPATRDVPFVLVADAEGGARLDDLAVDADDYLVAPFSTRELLARVRAQLQVTRARRESDAHVARLLARMPVGCIMFDRESRIVDWNRAAEAIFGFGRDEVVGRRGPEVLLAPAQGAAVTSVIARLLAGDMDAHSINPNVTKDGRTIVSEWHNTPIQDDSGTVVGMLSMVQDITERTRAEAALRASEERVAAELAAMTRLQEVSTRLVGGDGGTLLLEEIIAAAIAITGADRGLIQLVDPRAGDLRLVAGVGFGPEFLNYVRDPSTARPASALAVTSGERVVVEDVGTSPVYAGSPSRDAALAAGVRAVQATPLLARSGRLVGVLSTHYGRPTRPAARDLRVLDLLARQAADWVERTQAAHEARASDERYRALVSQVQDYAIFAVDERGAITSWNEGCLHVLGYPEREFVGMPAAALFTREDRGAGKPQALMRRIAAEHAVRGEGWLVDHAGRRVFVMGTGTALRDADGRVAGVSVVLRDATQMKLARDELAQRGENLARLVTEQSDALQQATERLRLAERMASLGTLAAGLGHDLGNLLLPLEVRLGALEQADLRPELRDHVEGIAGCVQYLERVSSGLRLLAVDPADAAFAEPTELGAWWGDAAAVLKHVLPQGITFEGTLPAAETWVAMGRVGLTQAVLNLVQNAADALRSRRAGHVVVAVEPGPEPETVVVRVSDDGPGMTPEVARRSTEPYFTTKPRGVSTGMGLALVHGLVTGAGGHVAIASAPGAGTTVRLVLPGAVLPERPPGSARRRRKPRSR